MTVRIEKPAINVREELADLRKPSGVAGEAMLRADTPQEQFNLIGAGRRNIIINGDMRINQRQNTPFTNASGYTLDRWNSAKNYGGWSISDSTGHAAETGFNHAIKIDCTSTATMSSNSYAELQHKIEGSNLQHLQWGGTKGKSVTLSFWVKSNLTGLYSVTVSQGGNLYNASYTIDSPNTWEKKYITIPPLTTASIPDGNGSAMVLEFWISLGTAYTVSTTDWGSSPSYGRDGQVNFMSSTDNEWLLTGVQLELGRVATPFEHRSYGEELAACQRYTYVIDGPTAGDRVGQAFISAARTAILNINFPVVMRAKPTLEGTASPVTINDNSTADDSTSIALNGANKHYATLSVTTGSDMNTYRGAMAYFSSNGDNKIIFKAEL